MALNPRDPSNCWTITHSGEDKEWQATFSLNTPSEALSVLTRILTQLPAATPPPEYSPIRTAEWVKAPGFDLRARVSPDGYCNLLHVPALTIPWWIDASVLGAHDTHWGAGFTTHTPTVLVSAFVAAIAMDTPVLRRYGQLPLATRRFARITDARGSLPGRTPTPPRSADQQHRPHP